MQHRSRLVTMVSTAVVLLGSVALSSEGSASGDPGCYYVDMEHCPPPPYSEVCHDYADQQSCSYFGPVALCVNNPLQGGFTLACCEFHC